MEVKESLVKQQIDIIYRSHPVLPSVDCKFAQQEWKQGQTVREILVANGVDQFQPIVVILNDRLLTVTEWDTVCPENGSIINVKAQVANGDGDNNKVLNTVLMVAVVVAALTIPGAQWGLALEAGTFAYAAASAGIMIAGSLIVNALVPVNPVSTNYDTTGGNTTSNPVYSLSGGQNRIRPYESMPIIMGTHKFIPDLASKPYTEYQGEDQYLYQIFHLGLSACDFSEWKIGENALENYSGYTWYYINQYGQIEEFPGNVDTSSGAKLEQSTGWITRTTSTNTFKVGIDIEGVLFKANDRGGLEDTSVQLRVQYKSVGSSTWIDPSVIYISGPGFVNGYLETYTDYIDTSYWDDNGNFVSSSEPVTKERFVNGSNIVVVSGNSQTPRRATLQIGFPSAGQYDVRVIRDTADSTDSKLQNSLSWSTLKSYQQDLATYVGQNRVGLYIRASEQLNGAIQQLSVTASARASYYNGSSWVFAKTSNPAHWFMDFAIGRYNADGKLMYGLGLQESQIDLSALTAWATFCSDEEITFNAIFNGTETAADVLTAISRTGFASPTWSSGKLGVVWDGRNKTAVAAFGMGNIIKGSFSVSYATESLADEIIVRYVNPGNDWKQDEVRVNVTGVTEPTNPTSIDLMGCTSTSMAGKFANYIAAQQYYRKRRITWDTDFEGFVCQRGDVVMLSHDLTQWGYSGRVVSVSGNVVTLDREVPRSGSVEYFMLRKPDGTMTTYSVTAGSGNSNQLTLTSTPSFQSGYMEIDHIWFFSPLATPGKKVKIISVQPKSESLLTVVATDEYPEFYAAWDGEFTTPPSSTLLLKNTPIASNIRVTESLYRGQDNAIKSHVSCTLDTNGVWERINIRYRVGNGAWEKFTTQSTKFEFDTADTGNIYIEVVLINGAITSVPLVYEGTIYGIELPLPNVEGLTSFYRDAKTVLTWREITDARLIQFEIRKGTSWATSEILGKTFNNEFVSIGDGLYWVATYYNGEYSSTPQSISIEGSSIPANIIQTWDEEATGWTGTVSGGAYVDGTDVILAGTELFSTIPVVSAVKTVKFYGGIATSGTYEIPTSHIVDIGYSSPCNVSVTYRLTADNPTADVFSTFPLISTLPSIAGTYAGYANCIIQIAVAPDSGVFGSWVDFMPGSYIGRKFKFRAVLSSTNENVSAILDSMTFTVDVPDRIETGTGIAVPNTGYSVTYTKPFQIVPNVQITIVSAENGDDAVLSNETESGFDIIVNDSTDTPVARTINWLAKAY